MDTSSAVQRVATYSTKNTRASREIFEAGDVILRNNALHKLGDDSARFLSLSPFQKLFPFCFLSAPFSLCAWLTTPIQAGNS